MSDERGPRDRLWQVAARQRGYFTAADALAAGYSYQAQRFHRQRGNWLRVDRAVYRFREYLDLPSEDTDQFVRWSIWSRDRAVVSHTSALAVHDLGIANPAEIHLTVPPGFRQQNSAVVLHRARLTDEDVQRHSGFQVTTPLRAVLETAAAGMDQDIVDSAAGELLARGMVSRRRLLHAAQEMGARTELAVERALRAEAE
ncbi:type IV toxin-antitoxin system AbiEi family antitoxin domain-containing protein [Crossiella sp. SN42]|uniref:type IV toxin-antitoxin system AbiEi family antitoxin domain-containing protein n=1 Tax=Crossiella sp. SN42 TaxID=2944808 RepID=UPI00207D5268|nr:type IV toxin-antitoxin system AbiEi family antitoxin domain-containing protein [Crossiella sp. SN42]MCO1578133.1 type IV toxin-antitoxin system AbiEi family antitoxin domain-containing protein [Crossiella sp. SN42]